MKHHSKKILIAGGASAGVVFTTCALVPIVGAVVGVVAGAVTFAVVETAGFTGLGFYLAGKGVYNKVKKHRQKHRNKKNFLKTNEARHQAFDSLPSDPSTNTPVTSRAPAHDDQVNVIEAWKNSRQFSGLSAHNNVHAFNYKQPGQSPSQQVYENETDYIFSMSNH